MAAAIGCDLCQQEPAEMMQTVLGNGDTISVGHNCMVTFFAGALHGMLSDAAPETLNALSPVLVPLAAVIGPGEWDAESDVVKAQAPAGVVQGMGAVGEHAGDTEFIPDVPHTEHNTGPREDGGIPALDICRHCGKRIDTPNADCPDAGGHKTRIGGYSAALDMEST